MERAAPTKQDKAGYTAYMRRPFMAARYICRRNPDRARAFLAPWILFIFYFIFLLTLGLEARGYYRHLSQARHRGSTPAPVAAVSSPSSRAPLMGSVSPRTRAFLPSWRVKSRAARTHLFIVTAYEKSPRSCGRWADGYTATMTRPKEGRTIAVDKRIIPLGSHVWIEGLGWRVAEDVGGAIKGRRIDIYFRTIHKCLRFGRKKLRVRWIPPLRVKLTRREG